MSRRRTVALVLVGIFVVVPFVEIYLLIQLGQVIGAWWTILVLVADGVLGSYLMRREGRRAWAALQEALSSGRMPAKELADGALILIGGTLLVTPGFVSDVFGLFAVLPMTRPVARRVLARVIARRLTVVTPTRPGRPVQRPGTGQPPGSAPGGVVQGEVVEDD